MTMPTEAETCREYVIPRLRAAEWGTEPHAILEQRSFTDGRIVFVGNRTARLPKKRVDYLLRYTPDFPLAVVEAKRSYKLPSDGLQQAKDYAELLGLKFAYATNGQGIVEHDYTTGRETELQSFPTLISSGHACGPARTSRPRPLSGCSPPRTRAASRSVTSRRSPSTGPCRPSSPASAAFS